jgi:hypothetical protein
VANQAWSEDSYFWFFKPLFKQLSSQEKTELFLALNEVLIRSEKEVLDKHTFESNWGIAQGVERVHLLQALDLVFKIYSEQNGEIIGPNSKTNNGIDPTLQPAYHSESPTGDTIHDQESISAPVGITPSSPVPIDFFSKIFKLPPIAPENNDPKTETSIRFISYLFPPQKNSVLLPKTLSIINETYPSPPLKKKKTSKGLNPNTYFTQLQTLIDQLIDLPQDQSVRLIPQIESAYRRLSRSQKEQLLKALNTVLQRAGIPQNLPADTIFTQFSRLGNNIKWEHKKQALDDILEPSFVENKIVEGTMETHHPKRKITNE